MNWDCLSCLSPYIASVVVSLGFAAVVWRRRRLPGALSLFGLLLAIAEWSACNAFELAAIPLPQKIFWANLQYIGIVAIPSLALLFALEYTGSELRNSRWLYGLSAIPLVTVALVWTDGWHGLVRYGFALDTSGPLSVVTKHYGPWFWVAAGNNYFVLVAASLVILSALRSHRLYRGQSLALLIGAVTPALCNWAYITGLARPLGLDLTPPALAVSGVAWFWAVFRYRLLDIVPVARDVLFERMSDGVIALDADDRIVDYNPAASPLFGSQVADLVGRPVAQVLAVDGELPPLGDNGCACAEMMPTLSGNGRCYELSVSTLLSPRGVSGRLLVWHDVTERRRIQLEREELIRDLQDALSQVRRLSGLLPICACCKKIRDENGEWREVEVYVRDRTDANFSHGICPDCMKKHYGSVVDPPARAQG